MFLYPIFSLLPWHYSFFSSVDKPNTCASTTSSVLLHYFNGKRVALDPGSPCSGNRGYCDRFKVCRILDADGPIARLKNSFLKLDEFDDLAGWMKVCCSHLKQSNVTC